jgi:hypothetical protein
MFFVLSAGEEISEIYACMTQNPAPHSHPIIRDTMKSRKRNETPANSAEALTCIVRLRKRRINPSRLSPEVYTSIRLRPYVSESFPKKSPQMKVPIAENP